MKNNEFKSTSFQQSVRATDYYAEPCTFTSVAHFTLSPKGHIISVNAYGVELLDKKNKFQVIGYHFDSFIADMDRPRYNSFLHKLVSNNATMACELTNKQTTQTLNM